MSNFQELLFASGLPSNRLEHKSNSCCTLNLQATDVVPILVYCIFHWNYHWNCHRDRNRCAFILSV